MKRVSIWKRAETEGSGYTVVDESLPRLSKGEALKVAEYLISGVVVLRTSALIPDPLSRSDDPVVPMSTRTDGEWIWSAVDRYYVKKYQISPGEEFMNYLRGRDFVPRTPSPEELDQAWEQVMGTP